MEITQDKEEITAWLKHVPDELLNQEYMRRVIERRVYTKPTGRPKVLKHCPKGCGRNFGVNDMRKHVPGCNGQTIEAE